MPYCDKSCQKRDWKHNDHVAICHPARAENDMGYTIKRHTLFFYSIPYSGTYIYVPGVFFFRKDIRCLFHVGINNTVSRSISTTDEKYLQGTSILITYTFDFKQMPEIGLDLHSKVKSSIAILQKSTKLSLEFLAQMTNDLSTDLSTRELSAEVELLKRTGILQGLLDKSIQNSSGASLYKFVKITDLIREHEQKYINRAANMAQKRRGNVHSVRRR